MAESVTQTWPCGWLIEVASGHPEPDSYADTIRIIECGAPAHDTDDGGWECEAGHFHEPIERAWQYGSRTHEAHGEEW